MTHIPENKVATDIASQAIALAERQRDSFIDESCGGDHSLKAKVLQVLFDWQAASTHDSVSSPQTTIVIDPKFKGAYETSPPAEPQFPEPAPSANVENRIDEAHEAFQTVAEQVPSPPHIEVHRHTSRDLAYEILEELGRGGMGIVHRARHRSTGHLVALKTIRNATPGTLLRFKKEFRTVAALAHPNIISLRELVSDENGVFFTMELLKGCSLEKVMREFGCLTIATQEENKKAFQPNARFRNALTQLATAIATLHDHGVLHRDIKPSNVWITDEDRVVLLDFGLAGELALDGQCHSFFGSLVGTLPYMAPEQAAGMSVTPAADWYAFGVIIYQVLVGRVPFSGSFDEIVFKKQNEDPCLPSSTAGIAPDLAALCMDLLDRDPSHRPGASDILKVLCSHTADNTPGAIGVRRPSEVRLVGRNKELDSLHDALHRVEEGNAICIRMSGTSGSGKSSLVSKFLGDIATDCVVLEGRCFEQEFVPFKAFDGVVDSLCQFLSTLRHTDLLPVLPRDINALVGIFPVLGEVIGYVESSKGRSKSPDARENRSRGLTALREMLSRIGDRHQVVVYVDDFQWADVDSVELLEELLRLPTPPSIMCLLSYRSEDVTTSILKAVRNLEGSSPSLEIRDFELGPLAHADSISLIGEFLKGGQAPADDVAARIVKESGGNPYYLCELSAAIGSGSIHSRTASLDQILLDRITKLSGEAQQFLELCSVASRPLHLNVISSALGASFDLHSAISTLRSNRFIRITTDNGEELVATYHDRIRESLAAALDQDTQKRRHLAIARSSIEVGRVDSEFLAIHFHRGGDLAEAGCHYVKAADAAATATAFHQAARLYRFAIDLNVWDDTQLLVLQKSEAIALENAGRGAEAASKLLLLSKTRSGDTFEWRRKAGEQLLVSGHIDDGLIVMREVIKSAGLSYPSTPFRALLGVMFGQLQVGMKRLDSKKLLPRRVDEKVLRSLDTCWSAATGLTLADPIQGFYFHTRGLILALKVCEPLRLSRALAFESIHCAMSGPSSATKGERMIGLASEIAIRSNSPYSIAFVRMAQGMRAFLFGNFKSAVEHLYTAERSFRDNCTGVTWEIDSCRTWWLLSLVFLGEWAEINRSLPALLSDARARSDLFSEVYMSTFIQATGLLALDQPDLAEREIESAMARWPANGFHVQHHNALVGRTLISLYREEGEKAWKFLIDKERVYRWALMWRVQQVRVDFVQLRARSLIVCWKATRDRSLLLRAERDAKMLEKESGHWASALGSLMSACVQHCKSKDALPLFQKAGQRLSASNLSAFAASAKFRIGECIGGEQGTRLQSEAIEYFSSQGVVNPRAMINSHAPIGSSH